MRGQHKKFYTDGVPSVQSTCQHTSCELTRPPLAKQREYEKCARRLTPVGNQLPRRVGKIDPCVCQRLSWG
jgi:hypothetical protein